VASEHVKVVLTGEGSDELFGGYPRYRWFARAERLAQLPLPLRTLAARLTQQVRGRHQHNLDLMLTPRSTLERHLAWIGVFADEELDGLLEREVAVAAHDAAVEHLERLTEDWAERPPAERAMYADFKTWLVDDILTKADRMTMAASIEARAPFLDHRVIEFAFSLPSAARLAGAETKQLLRDAMTGSLPASVLARPKHAFLVPVERWLETRFATAIRELLLSNDAATRTLIRRRTVERLLSAHGRGVSHRLWTLAVLELWLRGMSAAPRGAPE